MSKKKTTRSPVEIPEDEEVVHPKTESNVRLSGEPAEIIPSPTNDEEGLQYQIYKDTTFRTT